MILLSASTEKLQLVLGASVAANHLQWQASFARFADTAFEKYGATTGVSNDTTDVDLLVGIDDKQVVLRAMTVYNADTSDALVIIKKDVSGTESIVSRSIIPAGGVLSYDYQANAFALASQYLPVKEMVLRSSAITMTNANPSLVKRFAANVTTANLLADLKGYSQIRMLANCSAASASANNPMFRLEYYMTWSTTLGNFLQLGASAAVEFSVAAVGWKDTGWMDLATNARIDDCCLGFMEVGGDGAADPALNYLAIRLR